MNGAGAVPVLLLAIGPKTAADREKLDRGLQQLMAEDPTFRVQTDQQTGQVIIGGSGDLQLEIIVDRLSREFKVEATLGKPQVVYKETLTQDGPVLLEPVMRVEVVVPQEHAGDVMGDLSSRRGQIQSHENRGGTQIIQALVPLSEMFGYASDLRSRTRGLATCSIHFDRYQQVRVDPDISGDDRNSLVVAPLKPVPRLNDSAVALPEPDDDGLDT